MRSDGRRELRRRRVLGRRDLRDLLGRAARADAERGGAKLRARIGLAGAGRGDRAPIVAGGLVWATAWSSGHLFGLNPQTGQVVISQSTPSMDHFATPSASDGKLFLATGATVEAYTIANPLSASPPPSSSAPPSAPTCTLKLRSNRVKTPKPRRARSRKHLKRRARAVSLVVRCSQDARVTLAASVTEALAGRGKHGRRRTRTIRLAEVQSNLRAGVASALHARVPAFLVRALQHRMRESGTFTLTGSNVNGTARVTIRARLKA